MSLASVLGYRAYVHDQSRELLRLESRTGGDQRRETEDFESEYARRSSQTVDVDPSSFTQRLLAMPEPARNQIFWLTLRDAGFECEEVQSSEHFGAAAWLARCGEPWVYEVMIDGLGHLSAKPRPYGDFQLRQLMAPPDIRGPLNEGLDELRQPE